MNTLPFEILEEIVAYIPTESLHNKCLISRTWYNLVRNELYHKLKESTKEMDKLEEEYREFSTRLFDADDPAENSILQLAIKYLEGEIKVEEDYQLDISENMLKYGMLVDEEERKRLNLASCNANICLDGMNTMISWIANMIHQKIHQKMIHQMMIH